MKYFIYHFTEVKGLTQADRESILFTSPPICKSYNRQSKVVENVNCYVIIYISSSFCCCYFTSWMKASRIYKKTVRISYILHVHCGMIRQEW